MVIPKFRTVVNIRQSIKLDGPLALLCLLIGGLVGAVTGWGLFTAPTLVLILCCLLVAAYRYKLSIQ